ncbi:MAG TPA: hypothetical protein VJN39_12265 [Gemmatimonadales bacterium]|nr:hypothetical protein [Gemmatimonadales bacterium]
MGPVSERLGRLLDAFSPWGGISLTYRQFAAEIGPPLTEAAIKKWPQRKKFPADVARLIVSRARERNLAGVTLEWVLWGEGPGPDQRRPAETLAPVTAREQPVAATSGPHGQFARRISAALETDLSHNEFGQWSTTEVQRTVLWALKDLARRLRVLQFDMGETFELTDAWAGEIGLPVRPRPVNEEPG